MFNSKYFTIAIILTFIAVAGIIAFQVLEMRDYQLIETTLARFK